MKSVFNRLTIGLATAVVVLAQVVMPVQAAFAYAPTDTPTNGQLTICHSTQPNPSNGQGQGPQGNPYNQITVDLSAVDGEGGNDHTSHTGVADGQPSHVYTPGALSWGDIIPAYGSYAGLNWDNAGKAIYYNDCNIPGVATAVNGTFTDPCGPTPNAAFVDPVTTGVTYHPVTTGNTTTVTATANTGYVLSNPNWSQTYTDQLVSCETETPKDATAEVEVSTPKCDETGEAVYTNFAHIISHDALSQEVGTHTVTVTAEAGHLFANGTDTLEITYTIKPAVDCETPPEVIATPVVTVNPICGVGTDTLNIPTSEDYTSAVQWNEAHTIASVTFTIKDGVNKTFVEGMTSVTVRAQEQDTKGCHVTRPCSVENHTYIQPWTYGGVTYPEADLWPVDAEAHPGTFEFVNNSEITGLHLVTLDNESYTDGLIDGGETALADVDAMTYKTFRNSTSTGYAGTLPAYILFIDKDGDTSTTTDQTYLFYEPYNNGAVVVGSWQTWDALNGGNAQWWMSGTGQALHPWSYFVTTFPDAKVLAYGFNQGTYNPGTDAYVQSIEFDCATTNFSAPGKGGENPDRVQVPATQETVDPCNPTGVINNVAWKNPLPATTEDIRWSVSEDGKTRTASLQNESATWTDGTTADKTWTLPADSGVSCEVPGTPVTPGKGEVLPPAKLPQLLPHTGPSDTTSARGLLLALIAAIATYGAVYFAQGKRRFEQ